MRAKPSKRQQWYALGLILGSNLVIVAIRQAGRPTDWRTLLAVGICVLGLIAGAIWLSIAYWRFRKASRQIEEPG